MYVYRKQNDKKGLCFEKYDEYSFHSVAHVQKEIEFVYMMDGELTVTVDGHMQLAQKGDCILILPHQIHFYEAACPVSSVVVNFSGELVQTFLSEIGDAVPDHNVFSPDDLSRLLIEHMLLKSEAHTLLDQKSVMYAVCSGFLKSVHLKPRQFPDNAPAYRVIHYVAAHYREDISMSRIAQTLGYEYHYLSRIFHQTTNLGFRDFVNCHRIEYARSVIRNSDASLAQIAREAGFQNVRSFDRAFLKATGVTPLEYRKNPG